MRPLRPPAVALAISCFVALSLLLSRHDRNSVVTQCSKRPGLTAYRPSEWEQEWYKLATPDFVENRTLCDAVASQPARIKEWLDVTASISSSNLQGFTEGAAVDPGAPVFSHFEWKDSCTGSMYLTPIEPLVGHMRHPLAPHCTPNSSIHIESKDYILFSGLTAEQFKRTYPGRKLLMDFGAGQGYDGQELRSSLSYLLAHYKRMGVHFDEVWAWEPRPVNQTTYWQGVPPDVMFRLHLYNTGLAGDVSSPAHPIQYIKQHVEPGDFLVIKLDVDNQSVEMPFIAAVQFDADLRSRIGEIHFEMHYIHRDMPWFVGYGDGITYNDALNLFHSLRHEGLRIHYWP